MNNNAYTIKKENIDFKKSHETITTKGTRKKELVVDNNNEYAFFKYENNSESASEACSEKMCYEIAKVLEYPCAKIELARDENNKLGILNYLFIEIGGTKEHTDAKEYLNKEAKERSSFHTISNIKKVLDELNPILFNNFIKIMIFDALVGEQDRHEENWGIDRENGKYSLSPLYDNGDNLLKDFKNESFAIKYYTGTKLFDNYINKSRTLIYKEDINKRYKHFDLIKDLNKEYHDITQKELKKLKLLKDDIIYNIVDRIPDELLTEKHKKYIIDYLIKRRDILLSIID